MVQAVHRAMRTLRELMGNPRGLGVTELADRLGMAKPTVHALLRTLEAEQAVTQDAESGKYRLGPVLVALGNSYLDSHELRNRAHTWANLLADRTGEAVWVGVLVDRQVLVVHHAFRPGGIARVREAGATLPWNATALGKAIAAFSQEEVRAGLLAGAHPAPTGRTVTEAGELARQLDRVRETGHATEEHELTLGDAGIAAPVLDQAGRPLGAVGVVGPVERLCAVERAAELAISVRETARSVSFEFGAFRTVLR
ncbi:IclR family transcriptional regulator [Streptomyces sp. NPDC053431]|uniref:IclR family transcriptional regulator n=1 Tax=Streptomyces sp. NPDC053431 TaxID=3365703 RepID=UPI0037D209A1